MNNEKLKCRIIYKQALAGYLMMNHFVLVNMRPDNKGSGRNVFFFNDTPELQKAIEKFMA